MKLILVTIFFLLTAPSFSAPPNMDTTCRTLTGQRGLCVAGRLCRVRTHKLGRCTNQEQRDLYCCPFPTNHTNPDLRQEDSVPIYFPEDENTSTETPHFVNDYDYDESPGIFFPVDKAAHPETAPNPLYTKVSSKSKTTRPTRRRSSTTREIYKVLDRPHYTKPKILTRTINRKPEESFHNDDDLEDEDDQFEFDTIYAPKTTIPDVPKKRIDKFPTSFTYPIEVWTQRTVTKYSPRQQGRDRGSPDVPSTSTETVHEDKINPSSDVATNIGFGAACGRAAYSFFIAGGKESSQNQWPWMAAIFLRSIPARSNKFICGGSLINKRFILTAAHCCVSGTTGAPLPASFFLVQLGSNALHQGANFPIDEVKVHSKFSFSGQYNDIALMRLTDSLSSYTNRIAPVCLPLPAMKTVDWVDQSATVVGWGAAYLRGEHQKKLHEVSVPIVSMDDCARAYSRVKSAAFLARGTTHVLCAGLEEGGKDSCQSDSGGPLMVSLQNDSWTIIGIVSFGYRCAEPDFPGVYTRVTHYLEWIYSNTQD